LAAILLSLVACSNNQNTSNNNIEELSDKIDSTNFEFILNDRIKDLQFVVNYNASTDTEINEKKYKEILSWLIETAEDPIFQKLYLSPYKSSIVVQIESITNKKISSSSAKKRIDDIVSILDLTLGTDAEDLPIFKTLGYLKYGNKADNYVKISFNKLMF